eukprot:COSAG06_NODE_4582_length_4127_cov_4.211271_3_plen_618_part_00
MSTSKCRLHQPSVPELTEPGRFALELFRFNERCAGLERTFGQWRQEFAEENRHALTAAVDQSRQCVDRLTTCESTVSKLVSDCAETMKSVGNMGTQVAKQFADSETQQRSAISKQSAETQQARAALESKLAVVSDTLKAVETSQRSMALSADTTAKHLADGQNQMQQLQQHLEERIREEHEGGQQSLQSLTSQLNALELKQDKKHHASTEHWQAAATQLDQQIIDATASMSGKMTELKASLKATADAVAAQSREADIRHDKQIKDVERALAQNGLEDQRRCQILEQSTMDKDKRVSEKLHELQVRLNDRMAENKQAMQEMQRATTTRIEIQEQGLQETIDRLQTEVASGTKAMALELERAQSAFGERHDDLQRELVHSMATVADDASRGTARVSQKLVELEDHLQSTTERLGDRVAEADRSAAADRVAIDRKHSTRSTALLERLQATHEIATSARDNAADGHERTSKLEQSCTERFSELRAHSDAATSALRADTDASFASTQAVIDTVAVQLTEKLSGQVEQLEAAVDQDLKPLMKTVGEMGETLVTVGEQAATADGTRTKLDLLQMDVTEVSDAAKALGEQANSDYDKLTALVDATSEEVQDLAVELSLCAAAIDV